MMSFLYAFMNLAIVWTNTTVVVPLGDSLEPYKSIPEAILYVDGVLVNDPETYYEPGAMHSGIQLIDTNRVKDYTVKYNVYFPTYNTRSQSNVTFSVKDFEAPIINVIEDLEVLVGNKIPDINRYILITDNYDLNANIELNINTDLVNMNVVGKYPVYVSAMDKSNNMSELTIYISVVDKTSPVIKQKSEIVLGVNEKINIDKYFTLSDNYDNVLITKIDDSKIDYKKPGTYEFILKVKDQSGNETSITSFVSIRDHESPTLILTNKNIKLPYKAIINNEYLKSFILLIEDNVDSLTLNDVLITSNVNSDILGKYDVKYSLQDKSLNKTEQVLNIEIIDNTKPEIIITKPLVVEVNEIEPDIYEYISLIDNYDDLDNIKLTVKNKVDMKTTGEYRLELTAEDTSKNINTIRIIFEVVDNIAPVIKSENKIEVTNYQKPEYKNLITVNDNYDKEVFFEVMDSEISYQKVGIYHLNIKAIDKSGNETIKSLEVEVKDTQAPEIILKTLEVFLSHEVTAIDVFGYIESVYDDNDKTLQIDNVKIVNKVKYGVVGRYQIDYLLTDESLNETKQTLSVVLGDYTAPVIKVDYFEVKKNGIFDYKPYVTAYDDYDGNVSHLLNYGPTYIPTNIPGSYEVVFYVHDTSGNYAEQKVIINVVEEKNIIDYVIYVGGFALIVGVLTLYYIYSKRKVKF